MADSGCWSALIHSVTSLYLLNSQRPVSGHILISWNCLWSECVFLEADIHVKTLNFSLCFSVPSFSSKEVLRPFKSLQ